MDFALRLPHDFSIEEDAGGAVASDDAALLVAFAAGDHEAFTMLYKRHSRAVYQFAFYMAGDAAQADELTQQVFTWLIGHPAAFDPERGSLPAFLGGVARKFLRRLQRAESRWSPLDEALLAVRAIVSRDSPALAAEASIGAAQVRSAIALLPLRYREAVVLCDLQEKPYAVAAGILDCSIGTVRSRLHRGRRLLARKLNPQGSTKGGRHGV